MRLKFFADESGSYRDQRAFALGGLLGDVSAWEDLVSRWKGALGEVPYFHVTDFAASRRGFDGWDTDRKQQLLDRLVPLVVDFLKCAESWALGIAVFTRDYNATVGKYINTHPDPFCLVEVLRMMRDRLPPDLPAGEQVPVVLELKKGVRGQMEEQYAVCQDKADPEKRLGLLTFGDKRRAVELQAADLIIYELFQGMKRLAQTNETSTTPGELRPLSKTLADSKKCAFRFYEFEQLREVAEKHVRGRLRDIQGLKRRSVTGTIVFAPNQNADDDEDGR